MDRFCRYRLHCATKQAFDGGRFLLSLWFPLVLMVAQLANAQGSESELQYFGHALTRAIAAEGRAARHCLDTQAASPADLEALRELGLSTGAYWDALTWLYHRQQNRCMREADERLALAIVRYRQAARRLGVDSRAADVAEELVWGGVAPEAAIHARWMVLPASVRERLEGLGSLQRPFNPAAVMKRLEGEGALPTPHQ